MNKLCYSILLSSLFAIKGYCQTIINGDFEINSVATCQWNLSNSAYNSFMSNSWGFGTNTSSGLDIQRTSCGYANSPSNIWFIGLAIYPTYGTDAFSLKIDANLIAGNTYHIGYYDYGSSYTSPFVTPLIIGLSLDSLTFGDSIYSSLPSLDNWTFQTFSFVAPNNGRYITIKNSLHPTEIAWNYVDGFQFTSLKGIEDYTLQNLITINPNPFSDEINVTTKGQEVVEVTLRDVTARKVFSQSFENSTSINTEQLAKGVYIYEVRNKDKVIKKGKVVKD